MKVVTNLDDVSTMLKKRGLEPNGRVQKLFTATCAKEMDPYVPMQQGILKITRQIGVDRVTYNSPYAKFQYYGKVMIGVKSRRVFADKGERKVVTDRDLKYHGAPKRGKLWDKRMWADKKNKILNDVAKAAGGKAE